MTPWIWRVGLGLAAYLIGAIPVGYLVGRANGVDIRTRGSGNIGATNVFRCIGKGWGILTFLLDAFKGFAPAFLFPILLARMGAEPTGAWAGVPGLVYMVLAIAGHNWPVYLGFKGGKGVATSAGGLLGVAPGAVGIGLGAFIILFAGTRYVSVGSIGAALAVALGGWWLYRPDPVLRSILTVLGLLVILRHKGNVVRLLNGTENRISFGRKERT
ncbi:MAG: glycerol-3-phosphate 1-O-acyltransferase PlsY [Kiritimatiellia bacterium]